MISERLKQHSASAQVFAEGDGRSRLVWIVDVLPNEIAPYMDGQMDLGAARDAEGTRAQRCMSIPQAADGPSADPRLMSTTVIFLTDRPAPAPSLAPCVPIAPLPRRGARGVLP